MNVTVYGVKENVQIYYNSLRRKFGEAVSWEKCTSVSAAFGEVIITLTDDSFSEKNLKVAGYENVSITYVLYLDPYRMTYTKGIGSCSFYAKQERTSFEPVSQLNEFEEIETYEERLLQTCKRVI